MKNILIMLGLGLAVVCAAGCTATMPAAEANLSSFAVPPQTVGGEEYIRELKMSFGLGDGRDGEAEPGVGELPKRRILAELPAVLAVARVGQNQSERERGWRMSAPDPETTELMEKELKDIDAVRRVEPILSFDDRRPSLTELRRQAASLGADILFVYTTETVDETYFNPAAWGYFSGVGLFVIPGNSIKTTGAAQGLLIDVKSGFPLGVITIKAKKQGVAAAWLNLGTRTNSMRSEVTAECEQKMAAKLALKLASIIAQAK